MLSASPARSSTLDTNILKMNFLLTGTQRFHDVGNRGARFSYLLVLLAFSQRQQNQPRATCKRRMGKQLSHLNKPQVSEVLMCALLSVRGPKSVHSCIEVSMNLMCFAEGKNQIILGGYKSRWDNYSFSLLWHPQHCVRPKARLTQDPIDAFRKNKKPGRASPKGLTWVDSI